MQRISNKEYNNIDSAKLAQKQQNGKLRAYMSIPYSMISKEYEGQETDITSELTEIAEYYDIYKQGADFHIEGTNGDYVGSDLKYRKAANLINKEARFLFGNMPDMIVESEGDAGKVTEETKNVITNIQNMIDKILEENEFEAMLLKAAKDCFIGKRVGYILNFNKEDGVTITFLNAKEFIYEVDRSNKLIKFVCFVVERERTALADKRIFKKKYELVEKSDGSKICCVEEVLCDGTGNEIEVITEYRETLFDEIPAGVILNDGLLGDVNGVSEIKELMDMESGYSKLANGDIDACRKSMNQVKYTVDMDPTSTTKDRMSTSPGSYWEFTTDQNLEKPHPQVGTIESNMSYSQALDITLQRMKRDMHETVEVPDVSIESIQGMVTSGKALKAIYWPLIVRCNEKMKTWAPQLRKIMHFIYKGSILYPFSIERYTDMPITPVAISFKVENNYPLPEDEQEEKNMDISEVETNLMSRKSYMKKWRKLTDQEAEEELQQMALERQILEDSAMMGDSSMMSVEEDFEVEESEEDTEFDLEEDKTADDMFNAFLSEMELDDGEEI